MQSQDSKRKITAIIENSKTVKAICKGAAKMKFENAKAKEIKKAEGKFLPPFIFCREKFYPSQQRIFIGSPFSAGKFLAADHFQSGKIIR